MGEPEVLAFLTHLAVERGVAASTQAQALAALAFLYREMLDRPLAAFQSDIFSITTRAAFRSSLPGRYAANA